MVIVLRFVEVREPSGDAPLHLRDGSVLPAGPGRQARLPLAIHLLHRTLMQVLNLTFYSMIKM